MQQSDKDWTKDGWTKSYKWFYKSSYKVCKDCLIIEIQLGQEYILVEQEARNYYLRENGTESFVVFMHIEFLNFPRYFYI